MRTLIYDTPSEDATHLEGTVNSVPFRVSVIRINGVIDIDSTVALVHEMEDQIERDIAAGVLTER